MEELFKQTARELKKLGELEENTELFNEQQRKCRTLIDAIGILGKIDEFFTFRANLRYFK